MRKVTLLLIGLFTLVLSGCARGPAKPVTLMAPQPGYARIYVYRRSHFENAFVGMNVQLDNKAVGTVRNANHLTFLARPGRHTLGVEIKSSTLFSKAQYKTKRIRVRAGRTYFYEVTPNFQGKGVEVISPTFIAPTPGATIVARPRSVALQQMS